MAKNNDRKYSVIYLVAFSVFLVSFTSMIVLGIITTTMDVSDEVMNLYLNGSTIIFVSIFIMICVAVIVMQINNIKKTKEKLKINKNNKKVVFQQDISFHQDLVESKAICDCDKFNEEKNIENNTIGQQYLTFVKLERVDSKNVNTLITVINYSAKNRQAAKEFLVYQEVYGTDIVIVSAPDGGYTKDSKGINEL